MNNRKKVIYIGILLIVTVIVSITAFSYAYLTKVDEQHGKLNMTVGTLDYKIESDDLTNNSITLSANESKEIELIIKSLNEINSKYKLYTNSVENVSIGYLDEEGFDESTGIVESNGTVKVKIVLENDSDTSKTITFGVQGGFDYNEVALKSGRVEIEEGQALCPVGLAYEFDYTGSVQEFTAKCNGAYKLETWGAQGYTYNASNYGGKGGYSTGTSLLTKNEKLYIFVGQQGTGGQKGTYASYPNGGISTNSYDLSTGVYSGSGGGSTHIGKLNKVISSYSSNDLSNLLLVAGGGGSSTYYSGWSGIGGFGGGIQGGDGIRTNTDSGDWKAGLGAGQDYAGSKGPNTTASDGTFGNGGAGVAGGGGGFYGGGGSTGSSAGGGSGYISGVTNGQTIAGNQSITEPNGNIATGHSGNGYARITYLGDINPEFTNKINSNDNVTLDVVTNTKPELISSVNCYYGSSGNLTSTGTYSNNKCTYPIDAEYAKVCVNYANGKIKCSEEKQLGIWIIKNGNILPNYTTVTNTTITPHNGYLTFTVTELGRSGIYTAKEYDASKYGYVYMDFSYKTTAGSSSTFETAFIFSLTNNDLFTAGGANYNYIFMPVATKNVETVARKIYSQAISDLTSTNYNIELWRNSTRGNFTADIYNIWIQLKD